MTESSEPSANPDIPTEHHNPEYRHQPSIVVLNTGDGKGKSTAAFGIILRAVARGWKVAVVQFLKSGQWQVGEEQVSREKLGVDWFAVGEGFTWESEDLSEDEAVAQTGWARAKELIAAGEHRLVILDELTYPMAWGWIDPDDVVATIEGRPEKVNIVCTGRNAPDALVEVADTVTEMRKVKHAYDSGVLAKKGIDY